jgi:RNA polymerase sigma factor (sigma-70 family)
MYQHYHPGIYHYIYRFVKLPDLAEDLVHDVFLKVWEIRHQIDPELCFAGYLYRISRNHVYKTLRRIAADRELLIRLLLQFPGEPAEGQEETWQTREYERLFSEALSVLPRQRRKVFELCRGEGKTYKETAAILRISCHAVKKHMVLGMRDIHDFVARNSDMTAILLLLVSFS